MDADMRTVRFLVTRTVQREGGRTFHAGEVVTLPPRSAARWITRGVAEAVEPQHSIGGADGDTVDRAPAVEGADGGDPGVGSEHVGKRRGRRKKAVPADDSGEQHGGPVTEL